MEKRINQHPVTFIVLLWLLFVVLPIGNRGLWDPDEPRYLQVSWEMSRAHSYLIPIMNAEIYAEKPPLFFWLTILAAKVFPFEAASRWVSAFASLGILLLTYTLGRMSGNRKIGLGAALILMTCSLFTLLMGTGNIDTTLTFFTTLSLFFFLRWESERNLKFLILAYTACGIGILAKGPVALLIPWLICGVWESIKRLQHEKASLRHLAWGPLLALAIAALWLIPACIAGGADYTNTIVFQQQIGRAIDSPHHGRPFYYYLYNFPPNALPWFLILLGAVPQLKRLTREKNRTILILLIWFCTVFIFFSFVSGKRERYLLPAYPAFSLILAHVIAKWTEDRQKVAWVRIGGMVILTGTLGVLAFPLVVPILKNKLPILKIFPTAAGDWRLWALYGMGAAAAVLLWQGLKSAKAGLYLPACKLMALAVLVVSGMLQTYYFPYIDSVKSARHAAATIQRILPAEATIAFYGRRFDNGWNFYLNRARIPELTDEDIQQNPASYDMIILREKHLEMLNKIMPPDSYEIAAIEPIGSKRFVLLKKVSGAKGAGYEITHRG